MIEHVLTFSPSLPGPRARALVVALVLALATHPAVGQPARSGEGESGSVGDTLKEYTELWTGFRETDGWDRQVELINNSLDRYWNENEWNAEADQFAKNAVGEISRIPPWNVTGRLTRMTDLVSERYQFTEDQRRRFQSSTFAEMGWFMVENSGTILKQTKDFISMQSAGTPFTPELVAELSRESDPLFADMRTRLERMRLSIEKTMTPAQREIMRRDQESLDRRWKFFEEARQRWADGGWEPRDWGLEKLPEYANWEPDPRQQQRWRRRAAIREARERRERVEAVDETAWERYVRRFIQRYSLDEAQQRAAQSILRELQHRAKDYRESRRDELAKLPRYRLAGDPLGEPLRQMFKELETRLESIPTSAQRSSAAGSAPAPVQVQPSGE
ncbi:MAG: hypothetical protein GY842_22355 [bacterium]|nr:hypothetical protein [bacterium]